MFSLHCCEKIISSLILTDWLSGTGEGEVEEAETLLKPFRLRYPRVSDKWNNPEEPCFWAIHSDKRITRIPPQWSKALAPRLSVCGLRASGGKFLQAQQSQPTSCFPLSPWPPSLQPKHATHSRCKCQNLNRSKRSQSLQVEIEHMAGSPLDSTVYTACVLFCQKSLIIIQWFSNKWRKKWTRH